MSKFLAQHGDYKVFSSKWLKQDEVVMISEKPHTFAQQMMDECNKSLAQDMFAVPKITSQPHHEEVIISRRQYHDLTQTAAQFRSIKEERDMWHARVKEVEEDLRISRGVALFHGDIQIRTMETDIGRLRAYLGSKLFDDIVTGAVKPEPLTPSPWRNPIGNWRGPVR